MGVGIGSGVAVVSGDGVGAGGGSLGGSVGDADGSTDGDALSDGDADGMRQGTGTGSEPEGDGTAKEGITPLASGVGSAKQLGDGLGDPQAASPAIGPHDLPKGWNAPL